MFCASCGASLVPGSLHCGSCGSPVNASPSQPVMGFDGQPVVGQSTQPTQAFSSQPQMGYVAPPTSGKAIAALVLSLFGISLLAVIFGHIARGEIRRSGGRLGGDGLAIAGLIIGWLGMAGWIIFWIVIFAAASLSTSYYY